MMGFISFLVCFLLFVGVLAIAALLVVHVARLVMERCGGLRRHKWGNWKLNEDRGYRKQSRACGNCGLTEEAGL